MLATLTIILCLGVQAPTPVESKPTATPAPAVKQLTDSEAKNLLTAFKQEAKNKKSTLSKRLRSVKSLGTGSHAKIAAELAKVVAKGRSLTVRREAAKLLAFQPPRSVRKSTLKLLKNRAVTAKPELVADLIGSLDKSGYEPKDWKLISSLFGTDYAEANRAKQKAVLQLIMNHREIQGISILLDNLDEPGQVDNVDAADNPPAEYWEKRWKAWRSWRDDVKNALFKITGQRFNSAEEARVWIRKNKKKLARRRR